MKNVLIISPHPDDEAIGCGGAIATHVAAGDNVEVIFLTSGEKGGHGKPEEETISTREDEAMMAANIFQLANIEFWRQPDGSFEANTANVRRLMNKLESLLPDVIYVPHEQEDHPDHRTAAFLVRLAVSQMNKGTTKPDVWMYEVWTPLQKLDYILDFTPYVETKRKAVQAHKSQCDVLKFDEAILGLNRYRGEMHSWPGGDYAEVFSAMNFTELKK